MKKFKRNFIAMILTFVICISMIGNTAFAATSSEIDYGFATCGPSNYGYDDTQADFFYSDAAYIHPLKNSFMVVQPTLSCDIGIEYYDSNYNFKSSKVIKSELASFGGFYAIGSYYYLVTGQGNPNEDNNREVIRISKFDSNWKKMGSCSIYGGNTISPFAFGNLSMCHDGKYLIIHTCHTKYKQDGVAHQASLRIQVDTDSMTITDSFYGHWKKNSAYVSHSLAQFVQMDGTKIVTIDHCDNYPSRAVIMHTYANDVSTGKGVATSSKQYDILSIPANKEEITRTGVSIGGFEISSTNYIVAGTRYPQATNSGGRNIFLILTDKSTKKSTIKYITTGSNRKCTTPQLIKLATDSYLLMWSENDLVHYVKIDKNGNTVGKEYTMKGYVTNCKPTVVNNKLIWIMRVGGLYTGKHVSGLTFYTISTSDLSKTSTKFIQRYNEEFVKGISDAPEYLYFDNTGKRDIESVRYLLWRHNSNGYWLWYSSKKIDENDQSYDKYMSAKGYGLGYGYYPVSRWVKVDGSYYYFKSNSYMASNEWIDGYYLNTNGSWTYKGRAHWKHDSKGWSYKDNKGWFATGLTTIDEYTYYFDSKSYMQTGWKKISGKWYYFMTNGHMVKNTSKKIGSKTYKFNKQGICTNP